MLERVFSLAQREDETPTGFLARVAVRVFSVAAGLATFAYITFSFLSPFLVNHPYTAANVLGVFLAFFASLSYLVAAAVALGGLLTLTQMAWRIGAARRPWMEVVPIFFHICLVLALASLPAYIFFRGLVAGEIDHVSPRIKEIYRFDVEPTGYIVHMALHLAFVVALFWVLHWIIKNSLGKYHALTRRSKGNPPISRGDWK